MSSLHIYSTGTRKLIFDEMLTWYIKLTLFLTGGVRGWNPPHQRRYSYRALNEQCFCQLREGVEKKNLEMLGTFLKEGGL